MLFHLSWIQQTPNRFPPNFLSLRVWGSGCHRPPSKPRKNTSPNSATSRPSPWDSGPGWRPHCLHAVVRATLKWREGDLLICGLLAGDQTIIVNGWRGSCWCWKGCTYYHDVSPVFDWKLLNFPLGCKCARGKAQKWYHTGPHTDVFKLCTFTCTIGKVALESPVAAKRDVPTKHFSKRNWTL